MWNAGHGFMAIWSDVAPADFKFYHQWLLGEHFPERVNIPGFIAARVFRRPVGEDQQFFIIYETEGPQVLASAAYVERLNNPTAMSQAVMPKLKNFVRGAGRIVQTRGLCGGGAVRVLRFEMNHPRLGDTAMRDTLLTEILAADRVLSARLFEVDTDATTIQTEEKKIRTSKEEIYSQLLVIEAVDSSALESLSACLEGALVDEDGPMRPFDQTYQLIAELQKRSLA